MDLRAPPREYVFRVPFWVINVKCKSKSECLGAEYIGKLQDFGARLRRDRQGLDPDLFPSPQTEPDLPVLCTRRCWLRWQVDFLDKRIPIWKTCELFTVSVS